MENSDYLGISGKQLHILVTIHRAGSLSLAARMLGMNQSTLSYWLDQLRDRFGDALFVRVGQGMQPTERMEGIVGPATDILVQLGAIVEPFGYEPEKDAGVLRVACTAIERDLILHPLIRNAATEAPHVAFEVTAPGSGYQISERLREGVLDFAIYPSVLDRGDDLMQRALFPVEDVVFFDPAHPLAEGDMESYCNRPHARVAFGPDADFDLDRRLAKAGYARRVGLQVSGFEDLARLIPGTPLLATLPRHMRLCSFSALDWVKAPLPNMPLEVVLYWHARHKSSDRQRYWRARIFAIASDVAKVNGCA
jgi:DNA-binding transcriptional LysR family regulator